MSDTSNVTAKVTANLKDNALGKTRVVIVGGGNAGWLTAGRIAAKHRCMDPNSKVEVVLIESPGIPPIGVGEGTWPTMRSTLLALGISETEFIRQCDVTFKQGAKFARWVDGGADDFYYHPLVLPQGFGKTDLAAHWQLAKQQSAAESSHHTSNQHISPPWQLGSFANDVCYQQAVCEHGKAPKTIRHAEFAALANYAYHLDSGKFGVYLQQHVTQKLGVTHILDDVIGVLPKAPEASVCGFGDATEQTTKQDIAAVQTKQHGLVHGDLFVDCTGFASLLLGQHYQVPFISCSDVLFIDRALAVQVPYDSPDAPIATHTISTAQSAGWIWDIGLQHRRGIGYVYSSKYSSDDEARAVLRQYVGPKLDELTVRSIPIRSGHRHHFWQQNCVAVGLSAGFLEPLEASALVLVELSAQMIAEQLPQDRAVMDIIAKRFNETFAYRWQRIIDFLKLHYILTKRPEPFWRDNCDEATIPQSLKDLMLLWQYRTPSDLDFTSNNEVFPAASYQYVLYGMGFCSDKMPLATSAQWDMALSALEQNRKLTAQALAALPSHRDLLNKINEFGLSTL